MSKSTKLLSRSTLALLLASTSLVACADEAPQPDLLALPGQAYFPENLNAGADGTLYVGSLTTGQVVAFDDGATEPRTVIAAGAHGVTGVTGVLVQDDTLWLGSIDTTFQRPTEIRSFTLTGEPKATYPLAANYFVNDLAFDKQGNLYATDSFSGSIQRLKAGGTAFETYVQDARLAPATQGAFGLDGIVIGAAGNAIYVNKLDSSQLFKIGEDKTITEVTVTPPLAGPDGMRAIDDDTLLVIEGGANRLSRVEIHGTAATSTPLSSDLDQPTGVAISRGSAWVSEGQLGRLFTGQTPNLPFSVTRVAL
jgi:streptogramin lyase